MLLINPFFKTVRISEYKIWDSFKCIKLIFLKDEERLKSKNEEDYKSSRLWTIK